MTTQILRRLGALCFCVIHLSSCGPRLGDADRANGGARNLSLEWSRNLTADSIALRPVSMIVTQPCDIWVADVRRSAIVRLGCDGSTRQRITSRGGSLGRLRQPGPLFRWGADTVGVWDRIGETASLFDGTGAFVRDESITLDGERDGFARNAIAIPSWVLLWTEQYPEGQTGISSSRNIIWMKRRGRTVDSIVSALGSTQLILRDSGWSARFDGPLPRKTYVLFTRAHGALIVNSGSRLVTEVDAALHSRTTLTLTGLVQRPAPAAAARLYRDSLVTSLRNVFRESPARGSRSVSLARATALLGRISAPTTYPFFTYALLDDRDRLWLQTYGTDRRRVWRIYDIVTGSSLDSVAILHVATVLAASVRDGALYCLEARGEGDYFVTKYQ